MGWWTSALGASAIAAAGCAGPYVPTPPELPGSSDPPCTLGAARSYLIDSLSLPDGSVFPVDLSEPPDGIRDSDNQLDQTILQGVGHDLSDALERAVEQRHILWVVTTQRCQDASQTYARTALRRGTSFTAGTPITVQLASDTYVWSVGSETSTGLDTTEGIGVVPVAAPFDIAADTATTDWFPATMVAVHVTAPPGTTLEGDIALAVETAPAVPSVSDALARTLTAARAKEPNCPPTCSTTLLGSLFEWFDTNGDGVFDATEIEASGYVNAFGFGPAIDLLATYMGERVFWPSYDGEPDSKGSSYQFTASEVMVIE